MRRRTFISLLAGAPAWPLGASTQQPPLLGAFAAVPVSAQQPGTARASTQPRHSASTRHEA
jgi:hypothetical protein